MHAETSSCQNLSFSLLQLDRTASYVYTHKYSEYMYTYRDIETEEARGPDLGRPRFNFSIRISFLPYKSTLLSLCALPPRLECFSMLLHVHAKYKHSTLVLRGQTAFFYIGVVHHPNVNGNKLIF